MRRENKFIRYAHHSDNLALKPKMNVREFLYIGTYLQQQIDR